MQWAEITWFHSKDMPVVVTLVGTEAEDAEKEHLFRKGLGFNLGRWTRLRGGWRGDSPTRKWASLVSPNSVLTGLKWDSCKVSFIQFLIFFMGSLKYHSNFNFNFKKKSHWVQLMLPYVQESAAIRWTTVRLPPLKLTRWTCSRRSVYMYKISNEKIKDRA